MELSMKGKFIAVAAISLIVAFGEYKFINQNLSERISALKTEKQEAKSLLTDITPLLKQSKDLKSKEQGLLERAESIKGDMSGMTIDNEEFLVFIGDETRKYNVKLTDYKNLGTDVKNGVYRMAVDFTLKGSTQNINNVLSALDNTGIKYSVGSVSFRQDGDFDYLMRFFDTITGLSWYKEPEEDKKEEKEIEPEEELTIEEEPPIQYSAPEPYIIPQEKEPQKKTTPEKPETKEPEQKEPEKNEQKPKEPDSIDKRLDKLLELTKYTPENNGILLLANENTEYLAEREMKLSVTVCFIMFQKPTKETSFLTYTEAQDNGVL